MNISILKDILLWVFSLVGIIYTIYSIGMILIVFWLDKLSSKLTKLNNNIKELDD